MKNKDQLNALLIAAGTIVFINILMPILQGFTDVTIVKMNQYAAKIQAIGAKDINSINQGDGATRIIGFAAPSEEVEENEENEEND